MAGMSVFNPALWEECESIYPTLEQVCLQLQDQYGLIANLLLLAFVLDQKQIGLPHDTWQELHKQVDGWQSRVLTPFRRLRKLSKSNVAATEYQQMLDVELMLERKGQQFVSHQLEAISPEISEDNCNLSDYLSLFNIDQQQFPQLQA